jgi:molybdenum cofactor cytidylyltransferase/nicotine blue oxidoreductase
VSPVDPPGAVAAVVMAAGRGRRLGADGPKPLVQWRDRPLVAWALDAATGSGLRPVLLVIGYEAAAVAALAPPDVEVVRNPRWNDGMASSVRVALDALEERTTVTAVCVGLADQPRVGADAYRRLAAAHAGGAQLAVATYGGRRANPVLLGRSLWAEVRTLRGDVGARALMDHHEVVEVPCDGTGDPRDVDTPDDLGRLERDHEQT